MIQKALKLTDLSIATLVAALSIGSLKNKLKNAVYKR